MPKAKSKGIGKRRTGGGRTKNKANKQAARNGFETRHIDQVWEDIRNQTNIVQKKPDGTRLGPIGTTDRMELDADLPGQGKNYCVACSRYFTSPIVLAQHERSKPHKRRLKSLKGAKPHNQLDADMGGDMGKPDNGPRLRNQKQPTVSIDEVMEGLERM